MINDIDVSQEKVKANLQSLLDGTASEEFREDCQWVLEFSDMASFVSPDDTSTEENGAIDRLRKSLYPADNEEKQR